MIYARIDLGKTDYTPMQGGWKYLTDPDVLQLSELYLTYCRYKKFHSVMPIFDSEYTDPNNDVIGYYNNFDRLIAFSLIRRYNEQDAECIQFAWDYAEPKLRLGINSLRHECALYRDRGFRHLYLGEANEYKGQIQGFQILGAS
jgi:hypothetical protein